MTNIPLGYLRAIDEIQTEVANGPVILVTLVL
jgi:hypothetical protein